MSRIYEVERKFCFAFANISRFHHNKGAVPFTSIVFKGSTGQQDIYYDTKAYDLDKHMVWVRLRDGHWEAKTLRAGSHERATYEEVKGRQGIVRMLRDLGMANWKEKEQVPGNFGLSKIVEFATARRTYKVDGKFTVVLDTTDFGHAVGEVELIGNDGIKCHEEIDDFISKHRWFFETAGTVKSKMRAYWDAFPRGSELVQE
ncbi:hypothetical protein DRE_04352 [Drechslerella stenobrocha 248]|uniref:CYTH domain-containing protein n=1 Tax=Drechslerella stenobrocha 248 TaxID=1043628 RepID=W7HSY9_9PEZI|nr:hypothetical protein DRE_04352 [Drechslerella stenobrocha 248]